MNLKLFRNREAKSKWGMSAPATMPSVIPNPGTRIGDPLGNLTPSMVRNNYRAQLNDGQLVGACWALHEAMRVLTVLASYKRLWCGSLSMMNYDIIVDDGSGAEGERQAGILRKLYSRLDVSEIVGELASADLYGAAVMSRTDTGGFKAIPAWNLARLGMSGDLFHNPECKMMNGATFGEESKLTEETCVIRLVPDNVLLEYLRIFILFEQTEAAWDQNLQQEKQRQTIVLCGAPDDPAIAASYYSTAQSIADGYSGFIARGPQESPTEIVFPPASRGLPFYENRLATLDRMACKALFGSELIANTSVGSGTLAGGAHAAVAHDRLQGAAASISAVMQRGIDVPELLRNGITEPVAYFQLIDRALVLEGAGEVDAEADNEEVVS